MALYRTAFGRYLKQGRGMGIVWLHHRVDIPLSRLSRLCNHRGVSLSIAEARRVAEVLKLTLDDVAQLVVDDVVPEHLKPTLKPLPVCPLNSNGSASPNSSALPKP